MLESMFTEKEMKEVIKEKYNIEVIDLEKINRGSASITKIITKDKNYILKEFQDKYDKEFIIKEINIINFLKKRNIKVPKYISCKNGKYYFFHNRRVVIMQEFIEGYTINNNNGTHNQIIESAKYLGLIIKELENYEKLYSWNINEWFNNKYLTDAIMNHKELLKYFDENKHYDWVKKDIEDKIQIALSLTNNINQFKNIDKITYKNSHGDYSIQQFIYKDGKINAILDFISSAYLPICWEVIRSYSYIAPECKEGNMNIKTLTEYVKEFTNYVTLNEFDLKYMPYIYLFQILNSTYGYKQYLKEDNDKILNFAKQRTNFVRWLYKNAEELSLELTKFIKENY